MFMCVSMWVCLCGCVYVGVFMWMCLCGCVYVEVVYAPRSVCVKEMIRKIASLALDGVGMYVSTGAHGTHHHQCDVYQLMPVYGCLFEGP